MQCSGYCALKCFGLRALHRRLNSRFVCPLAFRRCGIQRILSGASAIRRAIVRTLGQGETRRYVFTFIDPRSRVAFAWASTTRSSRRSAHALRLKDFETELKQRRITHWWTYPKSPKMNAHIERFNRTLQESFVDYHEDLLFTDVACFNQELAQWLVFYNTQRPHHSLGLQSPIQSLLTPHPECQMLWTYTHYCLKLLENIIILLLVIIELRCDKEAGFTNKLCY